MRTPIQREVPKLFALLFVSVACAESVEASDPGSGGNGSGTASSGGAGGTGTASGGSGGSSSNTGWGSGGASTVDGGADSANPGAAGNGGLGGGSGIGGAGGVGAAGCEDCILQSCGTELNACIQAPGCMDLIACAESSSCSLSDYACLYQVCGAFISSTSTTAALDIASCASSSCGASCL